MPSYERFNLPFNKNLFKRPEEEETGLDMPKDLFGLNPRPNRIAPPLDNEGMFPGMQFDPTSVTPDALPKPAESSFMDEYDRITKNRPEQTRLSELINSAPRREDYKPNKMTRIGAVLGGISSGFKDAGKGIELAQNTIDRPYNEASAEYDRKLRNVGALAGMESERVREQIAGLQYGRQESRTDRREAKEDERDMRDFGLKQREFDAKMEEFAERGWEKSTDTINGKVVYTNRRFPGQVISGPVIGETLKERHEREDKIFDMEQAGKEKIANIQAGASMYGADARARTAASKLAAASQLMGPEDVNKKAYNDVAAYLTIQQIPDSETDRYYTIDDTTNRIIVKPDKPTTSGFMGRADSAQDLEIKKQLREILAKTYTSGRGNEVPPVASHEQAPGVTNPPSATEKKVGNWVIR